MSHNKIERCEICEEPTEKAGKSEDSIYISLRAGIELGPLCTQCRDNLEEYFMTCIVEKNL